MYTNLVPALIILRRSNDVLNRAYADVVRGSIVRALSGRDIVALANARTDVEQARDVFLDYGHKYYAAGAALELSLLSLALGKFAKARQDLSDLKEYAEKGAYRWERSAMIVESRILRHQGRKPDALILANKAYDLARKRQELLGQIDALVARSESYDILRSRKAIEDLLAALELNKRAAAKSWWFNPKVHGICHLHLVKHYLEVGRTYDALASFAEWGKVRDLVEHKNIHDLAAKVASKLDRCEKMEFRAADGLNYKMNARRLREFLLRQARMHHRTQSEMKKALGISRTLLNEWMVEFAGLGGTDKGGQKL
jgi:hypothetical protein